MNIIELYLQQTLPSQDHEVLVFGSEFYGGNICISVLRFPIHTCKFKIMTCISTYIIMYSAGWFRLTYYCMNVQGYP